MTPAINWKDFGRMYTDSHFSRKRFRRRVALVSFLCGIPIPTAMLIAGMFSRDAATSVNTMSAVMVAVLGQAVLVLGWYMKLGSDEMKKEEPPA